jgi:hypothetical protein
VTQTIAAGQTLKGVVSWRATVSGITTSNVAEVDFVVDGAVVLTEFWSPYGDTPGFLSTTTLANGTHTFAVFVTAKDGRSGWTSTTAVVAN